MYSYDDQNYNMLQKTILIEMLIFVFDLMPINEV